jgi:hypothetical protein
LAAQTKDALPASHPFHVNESGYDTPGDLRQQVILEALRRIDYQQATSAQAGVFQLMPVTLCWCRGLGRYAVFREQEASWFDDDEIDFTRTVCHYVAMAQERLRY